MFNNKRIKNLEEKNQMLNSKLKALEKYILNQNNELFKHYKEITKLKKYIKSILKILEKAHDIMLIQRKEINSLKEAKKWQKN